MSVDPGPGEALHYGLHRGPTTQQARTRRVAGSLIAGEQRRVGAVRAVVDPSSGNMVAEALDATLDDVSVALAAARSGLRRWRATPAAERGDVLLRAADTVAARSRLIARLVTEEQGKTDREAVAEVGAAVACLRWCAGEARRLYGRIVPPRARGERVTVELEPVGVVAALVPWNFPVLLGVRKLAPALAAGCAVVWKPAPETPGAALAVTEALLDAGLPAEALSVLLGDPDLLGTALATAPEVDMVSFTGSMAVGRRLASAAAGSRQTHLELGGHAPVIVLDDAEPTHAARSVARAKFRNAGQVCIAPSRVYVHASLHAAFVEELTEQAGRLMVGPGADPRSDMGPLTTRRRVVAVADLVDDALARGARLAACGRSSMVEHGEGHWYTPTVLDDVSDDATVMHQEPFGPVAPVAVYTDLNEVIARANSTPYGLAGFVYGHDLSRAEAVAAELEVGMTGVNTAMLAREEGPFGGVKQSGYGRENGPEGVHEYLTTRFRVTAPEPG